MNAKAIHQEIPPKVLDRAFQWAVVLGPDNTNAAERDAFNAWLEENPWHRAAWQRIQAIEQEFAAARPAGGAAREALQKSDADRRRRKQRYAASSLMALLVVLMGLILNLSGMWDQWQTQYVTAAGEQRQLQLAGGARLYMNSSTALDIKQSRTGTILQLYRGEILVDSSAAAKSDKPVVLTDEARFTPIGTRFVVQKQSQYTELWVTEGRVAIESADGGLALMAGAGQHWRIANGKAEKPTAMGMKPGAWVDGVIEADNARLGDVLDALGRHRRGWLHYDAAAANLRVTGVFRLADTDSALSALETTLPIRIERMTDWWVSVKTQKK
jgi:transmembrane sensor